MKDRRLTRRIEQLQCYLWKLKKGYTCKNDEKLRMTKKIEYEIKINNLKHLREEKEKMMKEWIK